MAEPAQNPEGTSRKDALDFPCASAGGAVVSATSGSVAWSPSSTLISPGSRGGVLSLAYEIPIWLMKSMQSRVRTASKRREGGRGVIYPQSEVSPGILNGALVR